MNLNRKREVIQDLSKLEKNLKLSKYSWIKILIFVLPNIHGYVLMRVIIPTKSLNSSQNGSKEQLKNSLSETMGACHGKIIQIKDWELNKMIQTK